MDHFGEILRFDPDARIAISIGVTSWPRLGAIFFIIGLFALAGLMRSAHRKWRRGWLSEEIEAQLALIKSKSRNASSRTSRFPIFGSLEEARLIAYDFLERSVNYTTGSAWSRIGTPHIPSPISFLILSLIVLLFFVVARPPTLSGDLALGPFTWWHDITALPISAKSEAIPGLFTGLVVIVLALVVFVAESIRDDSDLERRRVLLEISFLWPLGVASTLIPFGLLWSSDKGIIVVLIAIVAAFTLFAFARVVNNLLDPAAEERNRVARLRSRLRLTILGSVKERMGSNLLISSLGPGNKVQGLQYTLSREFVEGGAEKYTFFDCDSDGRISDVHLGELERLVRRLDASARLELGFGLLPTGPVVIATERNESLTDPAIRLQIKKAYILKRFGEDLPPVSVFRKKGRALLAIPKEFEKRPQIISDVKRALPHIFRFTSLEQPSASLRRELQATKDQMIVAIRNRELGKIDALRQVYYHIAEEFLTLLVDLGGVYSAETARKERANYIGGWSEVEWLDADFRELIPIAIDSGDTRVATNFAYLPFGICARAVEVRDHYFFQRFLPFSTFIFFLACEKPAGSRVRDILVDRSWRYMKEIAEFVIEPQLSDKMTPVDDLDQLRDFAKYIIRILMELLKLADDKSDVGAFKTIASELTRLFKSFRSRLDDDDVLMLRLELAQADNQNSRNIIEEEITRLEKRNEIASDLDLSVNVVSFALAARLLQNFRSQSEVLERKAILEAIEGQLPRKFELLVSTYAEAVEFRASDFWGWENWDIVTDGEVRFIDHYGKLDQLFIVQALRYLASQNNEQRTLVTLPTSASLSARIQAPDGLFKVLENIETSPAEWSKVLSEDAISCTPLLRDKLSAASAEFAAAEIARTRNSPLSEERISDFRKSIQKNLIEKAWLRQLFNFKNALVSRLDIRPGKDVPSLGYNQLDDKNAFIDQTTVSYLGWGQSYGEGLAQAENDLVFEELVKSAGTSENVEADRLVAVIQRYVSTSSIPDPIVMQSLDFNTEYYFLRRNPAFLPKHDKRMDHPARGISGFMGTLICGDKQVPIFDTPSRKSQSTAKVLIVDIVAYARWEQYSPADDEDENVNITDGLLSQVIDLNLDDARLREILDRRPGWLENEVDPAAVLKTRVIVKLYEKFRVLILNAEAAICLDVKPEKGEADGS